MPVRCPAWPERGGRDKSGPYYFLGELVYEVRGFKNNGSQRQETLSILAIVEDRE